MQLICLPFAGGTGAAYASLAAALPPGGPRMWTVELPGRGARFCERPFTRLGPLVDWVLTAAGARWLEPYALYGHSMGALVAFMLAAELERRGTAPHHLFVSGRVAPHRRSGGLALHALGDAALIAELRRINGAPLALFEDPELLELVLPTLRADCEVSETFSVEPGFRIATPLTVFGATHDPFVTPEQTDEWLPFTTGDATAHLLVGDHFFINDQAARMARVVREELERSPCGRRGPA